MNFDSHNFAEIFMGAISLAAFIINLIIRVHQQKDKAELVANQVAVKEELKGALVDTQNQLDVHEARDDEKFTALGRTLTRIEAAVTRSPRPHRGGSQ